MGSIWKISLALVHLCMLYHSGHGIECHDQQSGKLSDMVLPPCPISSYNNVTRIRPTMPTKPTKVKYTPLQVAAINGNETAVTEVLNRGNSVNERNARGDTALHLAATAGHMDVIRTLTRNGANVNIRGHNMRTPLICAAENGHGDIVQYLLANSANVNAYDIHENTALIVAVRGGFINVIKCLMMGYNDYRVPFNKVYLIRAAIIEAFEQKQIDILKVITVSKYIDKDTTKACLSRIWNEESFWILADSAPDDLINTYIDELPLAVTEGRCDKLRIIMNGVSISQEVIDKLLYKSASVGFCIKELLALGANVNAKNGATTPLYAAAYSGHSESIRILLDAGADQNLFERKEYAPLAVAIENECLNCTKLLLERAGGSVKLRNVLMEYLENYYFTSEAVRELLKSHESLILG